MVTSGIVSAIGRGGIAPGKYEDFIQTPGTGNSFIALSMALQLASGNDWLGRSSRQGKVLYVAAEGALGMKMRLRAHREKFSINDDNIRFIGEPFPIPDPQTVKSLTTTC